MPDPQDEMRVRALMGTISTAFINRDVATLREVFDDDFTLVEPTGDVVSKEQWIGDVERGDLVIESVESESFEIHPAGDTLSVRGKLKIRAKYSRNNYNGTFRYLGVYAQRDGAWKLTLSSARRVVE
jgi:ketosteroid isomerase-like protein